MRRENKKEKAKKSKEKSVNTKEKQSSLNHYFTSRKHKQSVSPTISLCFHLSFSILFLSKVRDRKREWYQPLQFSLVNRSVFSPPLPSSSSSIYLRYFIAFLSSIVRFFAFMSSNSQFHFYMPFIPLLSIICSKN